MTSIRVDSPEVKRAKKEGRVTYIGNKSSAPWYEGVVSRKYERWGVTWYEIDQNCVGGVPAPLAKRGKNPIAELFGRVKSWLR